MLVSKFYEDASDLFINKFRNVSNPQKLRYLNRAIVNIFKDVKYYCSDVYDIPAMVQASDGVITLPDDFNNDDHNDLILFYDEKRTNIVPFGAYRNSGRTLRMGEGDNATYYLEYTKRPSRYSAMDEELLEASSWRAFEMLQSEVEHIRDTDIAQGQVTGQSQAARARVNELS